MHRVSTGGDSPCGVSSCAENSAMIVERRDRGGGHGCRCDPDSGEGYERTDKGPRQCIHYGRNNHTSDKC